MFYRRKLTSSKSDVGLIKVYHNFSEDSILPLCGNYVSHCSIMGACGTGMADRRREEMSGGLKEILLFERPPGCLNCISPCPPDTVCTRRVNRFRADNLYHGDSGGPLYVFGEFPENKPICLYGVASYCGKWIIDIHGFQLVNCYYGGSYFASVPFHYNWIASAMFSHDHR